MLKELISVLFYMYSISYYGKVDWKKRGGKQITVGTHVVPYIPLVVAGTIINYGIITEKWVNVSVHIAVA